MAATDACCLRHTPRFRRSIFASAIKCNDGLNLILCARLVKLREDRMNRREFLIILVLSATMPCAHAQQPDKLYRIAIVSPSAPVAEMTDTGIPTFSAL